MTGGPLGKLWRRIVERLAPGAGAPAPRRAGPGPGPAGAALAARPQSEFLADMSHQLRTPLNGVSGLAQALEATLLDEGQRVLLADLRASTAELERLVLGLLDYGEPAGAGPSGPLAGALPSPAMRV